MHASQQHGLWSKCLSRVRAHAPAYTIASYREQSIAKRSAAFRDCTLLPVASAQVFSCGALYDAANLMRCTPVNTVMGHTAAPWHTVTQQTLGQELSAMTASYLQ